MVEIVFTDLERERISNLSSLDKKTKWLIQHRVNKKAKILIQDLIFLLENRESIGILSEIVGDEQMKKALQLLVSDMGVEQSLLTPNFVVSIIEENRVLANIIAKKNAVWRDLVAKVNSAKNLEDFVEKITSRDNVYLVDGENVRVHIRR